MPRRILEGNVVSNKTDKTITVLVERRFMHPVYKKYIKSTTKYAAHDELNVAQEGERVQIIECRPLSKSKRWVLLKDGQAVMPPSKTDKKAARKAEKPVAKKENSAPVKAEANKEAAKKPAAKKAPVKKTTAKKDA